MTRRTKEKILEHYTDKLEDKFTRCLDGKHYDLEDIEEVIEEMYEEMKPNELQNCTEGAPVQQHDINGCQNNRQGNNRNGNRRYEKRRSKSRAD